MINLLRKLPGQIGCVSQKKITLAMEDAQKEAIAVRKNMARLKELRLAKEAATIREQIAAGNDPSSKPKKRSK
jgi:hypothetical protein